MDANPVRFALLRAKRIARRRTRRIRGTVRSPDQAGHAIRDRALSRRHDGHRFQQLRRPARRRIGRDHPAVFPHRAGDREQESRRLRSGHRGRPRRRAGDAHAHPREFSRPRHSRRGIRRRAHRGRICLGARSDRRHQVLHHRHGGLGHADRPDALRRAGVRHDEPAVHARAIFRRRRRGALSRTGGQPRSARARLRLARRRDPVHHQPAADERMPTAPLSAGWKTRSSSRAMAATAMPIACWRRG